VLGGRVPILSATFTIVPLIKAGRLRAIAVSTAKRPPQLPDTPRSPSRACPTSSPPRGWGWPRASHAAAHCRSSHHRAETATTKPNGSQD